MTRTSSSSSRKRIFIIAGPNGAGKTTFAKTFYATRLLGSQSFINADLIARGFSPDAPEKTAMKAGRTMLAQIKLKVESGESFVFERTLSGRTYASHIPEWRAAGYFVLIHFLSLPNADVAISRVRTRVLQGGHDVSEEVIRRRFTAGIDHFHNLYAPLVDEWFLYDNSGESPRFVAEGARHD